MTGFRVAAGILALLGMLQAGIANAQERSAGRGPVEVGADWTMFSGWYGDYIGQDTEEPSLGLRVTVPITRQFAVEGSGTIGRRSNGFSDRTEGFYSVLVRQTPGSLWSARVRPFVTYGMVGYYAHVSQPATTVPQRNGPPLQLPARRYREIDEPYVAAVGGGVQYFVNDHMALRGDVQLMTILWMPMGMRYSAGVTVPLGR